MGGDRSNRKTRLMRRFRRRGRIGVRSDMTPMVDIAFLLLIFYMVSTVFALPQAMEVNLPHETENEIVVKDSCLVSILAEIEALGDRPSGLHPKAVH